MISRKSNLCDHAGRPRETALNGILKSGWVPIAHLLRPQGRRGELLAEPLSDLPGIFASSHRLILAERKIAEPETTAPEIAVTGSFPPSSSAHPTLYIEDVWFPTGKNAGRIVLKLSGCDDISTAETLAGKELLIATEHLPALEHGTFFVGDLVGCTLFNAAATVGTIVDVEFATGPDGRTRLEDAAPLLAVQRILPDLQATEAPEPVLIPFVNAWLKSVDIPARRIIMHLPEGLLDTPEASQ